MCRHFPFLFNRFVCLFVCFFNFCVLISITTELCSLRLAVLTFHIIFFHVLSKFYSYCMLTQLQERERTTEWTMELGKQCQARRRNSARIIGAWRHKLHTTHLLVVPSRPNASHFSPLKPVSVQSKMPIRTTPLTLFTPPPQCIRPSPRHIFLLSFLF